jgi:hypothetical protein
VKTTPHVARGNNGEAKDKITDNKEPAYRKSEPIKRKQLKKVVVPREVYDAP